MLLETAPPPALGALWTAGLALVTVGITQLVKQLVTPINNGPDWLRATVALVVTIAASAVGRVIGAPLPADLAGAISVLVTWAAAMGLHRLAVVLKVIPTPPTP